MTKGWDALERVFAEAISNMAAEGRSPSNLSPSSRRCRLQAAYSTVQRKQPP